MASVAEPPANAATSAAGALISIAALSKYYVRGDQVIPVLVDLNLEVAEGDYIALMGPSGSGKSTLLNLIAGIDKPSAGSISVAGVDIVRLGDSDLAAWRAAHVGFVFLCYNLMPVLTAFQNVELPLQLTSLSRRERRERVATCLELVGLGDRSDHFPNELSGGQQQRVAIARAIITDPTLIVLPSSRFRRSIRPRTSSAVVRSRSPVGSSATISVGSVMMARATAEEVL